MYLIVGLGNPGTQYARTRHNMGFSVIDNLAKKYKIEMSKTKFNAIYGSGFIEGEKVILVKPQTYINLSGLSVKEFINFYKLSKDDIIVIYDDFDIEKGIIKIRKKGGPGTHNGMKSVIRELQTEEFARIRIGIGAPSENTGLAEYVLKHIEDEEYKILSKGIDLASIAIVEIIKNGIDSAMNKYN